VKSLCCRLDLFVINQGYSIAVFCLNYMVIIQFGKKFKFGRKKYANHYFVIVDIKNLLVIIFIGEPSDIMVMFGNLLPCFSSKGLFCSSTAVSVCSTNLLIALFKLFAL